MSSLPILLFLAVLTVDQTPTLALLVLGLAFSALL